MQVHRIACKEGGDEEASHKDMEVGEDTNINQDGKGRG